MKKHPVRLLALIIAVSLVPSYGAFAGTSSDGTQYHRDEESMLLSGTDDPDISSMVLSDDAPDDADTNETGDEADSVSDPDDARSEDNEAAQSADPENGRPGDSAQEDSGVSGPENQSSYADEGSQDAGEPDNASDDKQISEHDDGASSDLIEEESIEPEKEDVGADSPDDPAKEGSSSEKDSTGIIMASEKDAEAEDESKSIKLSSPSSTLNAGQKTISKVTLKSIYFTKTTYTLKKGKTQKLKVKYNPSNAASSKKVKWKSSDKAIATVSSKGVVKAKKAGVAKITAMVGKMKAVCTITVKSSAKTEIKYKTKKGKKIITSHPALKYTYEVTPILSPFPYAVFVKTGNPDPYSFRFVDKSVAKNDSFSASYIPAGYAFADVVYENSKTLRVNGGYIFLYDDWADTPDGGNLTLQVVNEGETGWRAYGGNMMTRSGDEDSIYTDTNRTVKCKKLKSYIDYLIEKYTDSSKDLFTNLDAVETALNELAVYPKSVLDDTRQKKDRPYPLYAASPYAELGLNEHYEIYEGYEGGFLMSYLYPFVLDSSSFPGTMAAVAEKLQPKCKIENGGVHWLITVTYNNKSKSYGGAGTGSTNDIYLKDIKKNYSFRGGSNDFASGVSLKSMRSALVDYGKKGDEKVKDIIAKYDMNEEALNKAVKSGSWARIAVEGFFGYSTSIAYLIPKISWYDSGVGPLSGAWVDGRYVNKYERWEDGAKFEDYPTASVVVQNMTYKNCDGITYTRDVIFSYDSALNKWSAADYFLSGDMWYTDKPVPDEFYLTLDQVKAMQPDRNTYTIPKEVLVYDGTERPGTSFTNVPVTGLQLKQTSAKVAAGSYTDLTAVISPDKATDKSVVWTSSDEKTATVSDSGRVFGVSTGTVTITARSNDGYKKAACTVTVVKGTELKDGDIKLSKTKLVYNGKVRKPSVTVKAGGIKLTKGKDYDLTFSEGSKKPGTYTVTVKGMGVYTGELQKDYTITTGLKKTKFTSFAVSGNKLRLRWKKQTGKTEGYRIYFYNLTTNKYKEYHVKNSKTTQKILSGFKKGDRVFLQIATYRTIGGTKYYSDYSYSDIML